MRRIAPVIVAMLVLLLVASQFVLPPIAQHTAAGRLTHDGGSADVSIGAFPALRLLFGHGDSLEVDGTGIELPTEARNGGFDRLDNFHEVHIHVRDSQAGPIAIRDLT